MSVAHRAKSFSLAALALTVASACDPPPAARQPGRNSVHIFVVGESKDSPSSAILRAASIRFAHENTYATVEFLAAETRSPSAQQALLQSIKQRKFDALCIVPIDPAAIRELVDSLAIDGKQVVTIARDIPDSHRTLYCGPSEWQIGRTAATACAIAVQNRSKTVMLLHAGRENAAYQTRRIAFKEELAEIGGAELIAEFSGRDDPIEAARLVRLKSKSYPRVGCWVYLEDWPLRAISPAQRLLPLGCGLVLCNGSPDHFDRLRSGEIDAIIAFDYYRAVEEAISGAARIVRAGQPDKLSVIDVPSEIVTAKELDWHERRWDAWRLARPSPETSPW
jgi:ABC-type sugar transport system substrate-binding protein